MEKNRCRHVRSSSTGTLRDTAESSSYSRLSVAIRSCSNPRTSILDSSEASSCRTSFGPISSIDGLEVRVSFRNSESLDAMVTQDKEAIFTVQELARCSNEMRKAFQKDRKGWRKRLLSRLSHDEEEKSQEELECWIFNHFKSQFQLQTVADARKVFKSMLDCGFLKEHRVLSDLSGIYSSTTFSSEPHPRNQILINAEVDEVKTEGALKDPVLIAFNLLNALKRVYKQTIDGGDSKLFFDPQSIPSLHPPSYKRILNLGMQLKNAQLSYLQTDEEKIAFFVNLYNALLLHSLIIAGTLPFLNSSNGSEFIAMERRVAYQVGSLIFSLSDIKHGILRAHDHFPIFDDKEHKCFYPSAFPTSDPRSQLRISCSETSTIFMLSDLTQSGPRIFTIDRENVRQDAQRAMQCFLKDRVDVFADEGTPFTKLVVKLPRIFKWYSKDYGKTPIGILDWLARNHWDIVIRSQIADFLTVRAISLIFDEHDWNFDLTSIEA